jgi:hypothetical protein
MEAGNQDAMYPFGDFDPRRANDPYACMGPNGYLVTTINSSSNVQKTVTVNSYPTGDENTASLKLPRSSTFLSKNVDAYKLPGVVVDSSASSNYSVSSGTRGIWGNRVLPYPNTADNSLVFTKFNIFESSNKSFRGSLRGVYSSPQQLTPFFSNTVTVMDGQGDYSGRKIGVAKCNGGVSADGGTNSYFAGCSTVHFPSGRLIIDLTGPW